MTPEAARVIAAAEDWANNPSPAAATQLKEAVRALRENESRAWVDVVTGDEVQSKNGKWFEVMTTVTDSKGRVRVTLKGNTKPVTRNSDELVRVRRGEMGKGVDTFQVLWSASSVRESK